jgi:hypothetical protein
MRNSQNTKVKIFFLDKNIAATLKIVYNYKI